MALLFFKNRFSDFLNKFAGIAFLLFFIFLNLPPAANAGEHNHTDFNYPGNGCGKIMIDNGTCCHPCESGDCCTPCPNKSQCKIWQTGNSDNGTCGCVTNCLDAPANPKYYDDPQNRTQQKKTDQINLPVVLAWDEIRGWKNLGAKGTEGSTIDNFCGAYAPNPNEQGPKSYRLQIKYYSAKNNLHLDTAKISPTYGKETLASGQEVFFKVITDSGLKGFNSRDDGGACFFDTNTIYEWRVLPCCDANGLICKELSPDEGWWTFATSPAPEPLGITDKYHSGIILQDPDWNGGQATGETDRTQKIDYCSAKLYWCKAKLFSAPNNERFSQTYNTGQMQYAANYQMTVKFNESWSLLNLFDNNSSIPSADYQTTLNNALSQNYNPSITQAISNYFSSLTSLGSKILNIIQTNPDGESCHYLEPANSAGVCKPELLQFSQTQIKDKNFLPVFASQDNKSTKTNRNLFSGDGDGRLTYSWQTKICFDVSSGKKNDVGFPFCSGYNNEDYGQKWKFTGRNFKENGLEPPTLLSPVFDNETKDDTTLVGEDNQIQWSAPCGANSFVYDIQDSAGKSIFSSDSTYGNYSGRWVNLSQILLTLTDKEPQQDADAGRVNLKINTVYRLRIKSCWPSTTTPQKPVSEICDPRWTKMFTFITTGRAPKSETLKVSDQAPTLTFQWESVSGAKSYRINISGGGKNTDQPVDSNQFSLNYSAPKKNYSWKVKTCANASGRVCGEWQLGKSFNSGDFEEPAGLNPSGEIKQLPSSLSWSGQAQYYQVTASITNGEESTSCNPKWFNGEYNKRIVPGTSLAIKSAPTGGSQYCAGNYYFKVQPCFDDKCSPASLSKKYKEQTFFIVNKKQQAGFLVCGQDFDDTINTPEYNEKEPCEIKHLFLTLKVLVDFVIFKLSLWLLPVMIAFTGGLFYLSQDKAGLIPEIKKRWKYVGVGYLFLFFAWFIVSLLMQLAGYGANTSWFQIL